MNSQVVPPTPRDLSLPLFALIQEADDSADLQATLKKLQDGIEQLSISEHVSPVLSFDQDRDVVSVEPKDPFGAAICVELRERIAFPPCPPDMCEPIASKLKGGTCCRWCGSEMHLN